MTWTRRSLIAAGAGVGAGWAFGQPAMTSISPSIFETGSAHYDTSRLRLVNPGGGIGHVLGIAVPKRQAPAEGWPVFFALDGAAVGDVLSDDLLGRLSNAGPAIVALGHDRETVYAMAERTRDYTPPDRQGQAIADPLGRPGGEAPAYLDFLTETVLPEVSLRLPLDPTRLHLWGHSYGGLFALFAAFAYGPFTSYTAASPSLWWDSGNFWQELLRQLDEGRVPRARIATHSGTSEGAPRKVTAQNRPMLEMREKTPADALDQLSTAMRAAGILGEDRRFEGLGHGPSFAASLRIALGVA